MRLLAISLTMLLFPGLSWSGDHHADVEAIRLLGDRWLVAYQNGDKDALKACFTEDAWVMPRGRPKLEGWQAIVATVDARPPGFNFEVEVVEEEIEVRGKWAWSVGSFTVIADNPDDDKPPQRSRGRALLIYQKGSDGQWRIHRDMDTPIPDGADR